MNSNKKWDKRFLGLARHISSWSKDPSTKVGAVITRPDNTIVSLAFNGFPKNVSDDDMLYIDREVKYSRIIHAEQNALLFAKENLTGCSLYTWPFPPCNECAKHIVQVGIARVVVPALWPDGWERWGDSIVKAENLFDEAKIETVYVAEEVS